MCWVKYIFFSLVNSKNVHITKAKLKLKVTGKTKVYSKGDVVGSMLMHNFHNCVVKINLLCT